MCQAVGGRCARVSVPTRALLGLGILLLGPRIVGAQDELPNYRKPILAVETGGHHARVRSILWHDDSTLLTAGEDKVVKVWDVRAEGRLIRSIRPPIWRGPAGTIYAMAETRPDPRGQSFLAVGGYGVEVRRGDITVYRFPELDPAPGREVRIPTGDVAARLLPPPEDPPGQIGHRSSVLCLAFDPTGKWPRLGEHRPDGDPLGTPRVHPPTRPAGPRRRRPRPGLQPRRPAPGHDRRGRGDPPLGRRTRGARWTSDRRTIDDQHPGLQPRRPLDRRRPRERRTVPVRRAGPRPRSPRPVPDPAGAGPGRVPGRLGATARGWPSASRAAGKTISIP